MASPGDDQRTVETLWYYDHDPLLLCCHCGEEIGDDDVLIRTFALEAIQPIHGSSHCSRIRVKTCTAELLMHHRHLHCATLLSYVAVSHVWDPRIVTSTVSPAEGGPGLPEGAGPLILATPSHIAEALVTTGLKTEVWHDYISVPQWRTKAKRKIIQHIPEIFERAQFVITHLTDADITDVNAMREGGATEVVARAISNLCNARYFSRVWTAMEYTESRQTRVLLKDYVWLEPDSETSHIFPELRRRWDAEVAKHSHPHDVEKMANMGYNIVPWMLGSLTEVRNRNHSGQPVDFAIAYELLSRRNITFLRDFYYALVGTLKLKSTNAFELISTIRPNLTTKDSRNEDDARAQTPVLMQVMKYCLSRGDFSPIFIIPASAQKELDGPALQRYGYVDAITWGCEHQLSPPTYPSVEIFGDSVRIQAEEIGTITSVRRETRDSLWAAFRAALKLAIEAVGTDVTTFINTLGARMYGVDAQKLHEHFQDEDLRTQLQDHIKAVYDSYPYFNGDPEEWIADAMAISNRRIKKDFSPLASMSATQGSIHLSMSEAYIYARCSSCNDTFVMRAALLRPASEISGAVAYRVPGLRYWSMANAGGAGVLIRDGHVVGRFIWGTPTCECDKLRQVVIKLESPPLPRPNTYSYGSESVQKNEWLPFRQDDHVKYSPQPIAEPAIFPMPEGKS